MAKRCPALLRLFQHYYSSESICFYNLNSDVRLVKSAEGARIGCRLGSFAFALTVQDLYETIQHALDESGIEGPAGDGSFIKAATDDCLITLRASPDDKPGVYHCV